MEIQALGYVGLGSAKLDDWSDYATRWLGMQAAGRGKRVRSFRMDDRKQRLIVDASMPEGQHYFGWEVANAKALDKLAGRLDAAGVTVRRESRSLAGQRGVAELISFADPAGNRLEAFHGAESAAKPFRPGRSISGFRTGPLGMGHVALVVPRMDAALAFYRDLLGFRVSDYILDPVPVYFMHVNRRHHSLAMFEGGHSAMHHLMLELFSLDDVGQGYDIALGEKERIAATLGRHPNDLITSFYMRTPAEMLFEYGWGGREVNDRTWKPVELTGVASFWGHQGLFETLGGDDAPPADAPPHPAPAELPRAPVQVMAGNFERMSGACPWWNGAERRR